MLRKVISISLMGFLFVAQGYAANLRLGFVVLGDEGPFTKPAAEFAEKAFETTRLARKDLTPKTLEQFTVVWWHDGDSDPGALTNAEIDALVGYAEAGGAVLLTGWAIRYATPMGLEAAEARQFGPVAADGINVGITVTEETVKRPLLEGLKNLNGNPPKVGDRIQVNSTGYPKSGDYFDAIWKNFITLANAWGPPASDWTDRIAAFGYWKAGDGKVFNMNWRLPNFHENNKDIDQLSQLTENVINWLGSESIFFAVQPADKLPVMWGRLKSPQ
jgi:hypothetical protein